MRDSSFEKSLADGCYSRVKCPFKIDLFGDSPKDLDGYGSTLNPGFRQSSRHCLAGKSGGVAAVNREDCAGGFAREGERQKGCGDVFGVNFFLQQIPGDVLFH